mmetsp:Transcript_48494/g.150027  ORF Transcript_48494/g.150027 Transcript_48494/m.150027 type:complete len:250 (+) Transcript_48494:102-851(+)
MVIPMAMRSPSSRSSARRPFTRCASKVRAMPTGSPRSTSQRPSWLSLQRRGSSLFAEAGSCVAARRSTSWRQPWPSAALSSPMAWRPSRPWRQLRSVAAWHLATAASSSLVRCPSTSTVSNCSKACCIFAAAGHDATSEPSSAKLAVKASMDLVLDSWRPSMSESRSSTEPCCCAPSCRTSSSLSTRFRRAACCVLTLPRPVRSSSCNCPMSFLSLRRSCVRLSRRSPCPHWTHDDLRKSCEQPSKRSA